MTKLHEGQCGMCAHFGEHDSGNEPLVQIRVRGEAPEDFIDDCGHPQHAGLHLKVSAHSGCDGYAPAEAA